jgi:hypothetical protein
MMRPLQTPKHKGRDVETILRGLQRHPPSKEINLERRVIPANFSEFFIRFFGLDWKRHKKYETTDQAIQAYEGLMKTSWNRDFEWRLNTPVGIITLPVVKA